VPFLYLQGGADAADGDAHVCVVKGELVDGPARGWVVNDLDLTVWRMPDWLLVNT
jgi:hypothetical protein